MRCFARCVGFLALVGAVLGPMGGNASAAPAALCQGSGSAGQADGREMAQAAKLALPIVDWLQDKECLYPHKLMQFGSVDVLLTLAGEPGSACHGCAAVMSAFVFRRRPEGLALISRFASFGEGGTYGDPGKIETARIAGNDGFTAEHGGTFQGYSASHLDLYVFKNGKLVHLRPTLPLSASDGGAVADVGKATSVTGAWTIGAGAPKQVAIEYRIVTGGRTTTTRAVWEIEGPQLTLKSGQVPPEYAAASGGG